MRQVAGEGKSAWRQPQALACRCHGHTQGGGAGSALGREEFPEYRDEIPGVEGLVEEVAPQGAVSFGGRLPVKGGHHHPDGRAGCSFAGTAEPVQDGSTLAVGELEVEDRGMRGLFLLEDTEGFAAGGYFGDVKPRLTEAEPQHSGYRPVILDDEHSRPIDLGGTFRQAGLG